MSYKPSSICLNFSLLSLFLLLLQPSWAQDDFSAVDAMLKKNEKALGKQVVVLIWKDGKIIYKKETNTEFTAKTQTLFGASGQWITAAMAMALVNDGKIGLDDKTSQHIPILAKYMKGYITLRNGLTHTTGVEGEKTGAAKLIPKLKFESLEEQMGYFASKREIVTNPQTEFFYSHVGMNIAGRMLEVVAKKNFERIAQEKITRQVKMRSTSFYNYGSLFTDPSTGLQSTANDYINFLAMLVNEGNFEGKQVLTQDAVKEMTTPQLSELPVKYTPKGTEGWKYGLGAWLVDENVVTSPSLTGTWPYIDKKNKYAAILVAPSSGEQGNEIFTEFRQAVNQALGVN